MWKLAGLSHLSDKELFLLGLVAICCSFAVGWVMDMIMDRFGFGIFGNSFICMFGIMVGLIAYNNWYGRLSSPNLPVVMAFTVISVMLSLVIFSIMRRVLRL